MPLIPILVPARSHGPQVHPSKPLDKFAASSLQICQIRTLDKLVTSDSAPSEAQTVPTASESESEPGTMAGTSTLVAQGCLAVAGVMLIAYFAIQHRRKKANARPYYTRAAETPKTVRPSSH